MVSLSPLQGTPHLAFVPNQHISDQIADQAQKASSTSLTTASALPTISNADTHASSSFSNNDRVDISETAKASAAKLGKDDGPNATAQQPATHQASPPKPEPTETAQVQFLRESGASVAAIASLLGLSATAVDQDLGIGTTTSTTAAVPVAVPVGKA